MENTLGAQWLVNLGPFLDFRFFQKLAHEADLFVDRLTNVCGKPAPGSSVSFSCY